MNFTKLQIFLIGLALLVILVFVLIFLGVIPGLREDIAGKKATLNVWGVFDNPQTIGAIVGAYRSLPENKGVEIKYTEIDPDNYEEDLVNALAGPTPPDVVMIHSSWLPKHANKLVPATPAQFQASSLAGLFPTVVEQDFAPDGLVYALPLYLDTLALFYNQDIFDSKGVAFPPKTWEEFGSIVPKLRETDKSGKILKAASAVGGSKKSINRATDVLNLLFLQSGTEMVNKDFSRATFASGNGLSTLRFYTDFANPTNKNYTWNDNFAYSLDSFANEEVAMIFNYAYQSEAFKEKNPFLRFAVAPIPQPKDARQAVNFASYWGLAVTNKTLNPEIAWDFVIFAATDELTSSQYLSTTKRPPALRSLINANLDNPDLGVFARQALTARSWPQINNLAVENSFDKMISGVINGRLSAEKAIQESQDEITQLMERRLR